MRQAILLCVAAGLVPQSAAVDASSPTGDVPDPAAAPPTVPLVFIPGTTGTRLREPAGGRLRWGNARSLFLPRDRGYALALPLDERAADGFELVTSGPIEQLRIGPYRKPIYRPLLEALQRAGYVRGELTDPRAGQTLFVFAYDWRLGNVGNAELLARQLERLRELRGQDSLRVHLAAQSGGAYLARYLIKYGGVSLEVAERGAGRPPPGIEIEKLILIGTANGGALRILRDLNRGRRYAPLGRRFAPEVLFTFRSLFQDLPIYSSDLFFDAEGRPLDIDILDADQWRNYQWSIYDPRVAARLARAGGQHPFGDAGLRDRYLRARLRDARRFHRLLRADVAGFGPTCYYSLQNIGDATPARARVTRRGGRWRTEFLGDRGVDGRAELRSLATAAGDGHAVGESQRWLSPQEHAALAAEPRYFAGGHFDIILDPELHRQMLEHLREPRVDRATVGSCSPPSGEFQSKKTNQ